MSSSGADGGGQRPVLLAVDGNSLVHRSFHAWAHTRAVGADGAPVWAVRGLLSQLVRAVRRVDATGLVVGFDDPVDNVRRQRWPGYKATRTEKEPELVVQLAAAVVLLRAAGVHVVLAPGLEADDVVAAACTAATEAGWDTVVVTSDRDAFALVSDTVRVLRLITGGVEASPVLTPDRLRVLTGVRCDQYREFAALRGDSSDNLTGVPGIGAKTAVALLSEFDQVGQAWDDPARCEQVVGRSAAARICSPEARAAFDHTHSLMLPMAVGGLGLELAAGGVGCLPLAQQPVRAALTVAGLRSSLPSVLAALSGVEPELPVAPQPRWPMVAARRGHSAVRWLESLELERMDTVEQPVQAALF